MALDPTIFPTHQSAEPRDSEFVLYDESNPRSVVNIVWKEFRDVLKSFPIDMQVYFQMSETQLRKKIKPDLNVQLLRMRFWQEYDRAQIHGSKIKKVDLLRGICSLESWDNLVAKNYPVIAYLMTPPPRYLSRLEVMMNIGLDELADVLTTSHELEDGKIDKGLVALKVKIWELLDEKVRGATIQRLAIHQKIETTDVSADPTNLEDLDKRLKAVKSRIMQAQNKEVFLPEPKAVEVVEAVFEEREGIQVSPLEVIEIHERSKDMERSDTEESKEGEYVSGLRESVDGSEDSSRGDEGGEDAGSAQKDSDDV